LASVQELIEAANKKYRGGGSATGGRQLKSRRFRSYEP
jgi:hypothetical protein